MRKQLNLCVLVAALFIGVCIYAQTPADKKPEPRKVVLTDVQTKMLQDINEAIEKVPEVKAFRAKQDGIIAGVATQAGFTEWTIESDGKRLTIIDKSPPPVKPDDKKEVKP